MKPVVLACALTAGVACFGVTQYRVLGEDEVARRFRGFAADDVELYGNTVGNAGAFDFLKDRMPRFECPDEDIVRTYYFRWWVFRKHLRQTPEGWVITEFLPNVPYAGAHNTIVCPAGHHLREARWLSDPAIAADAVRFWLASTNATHRWNYASWPVSGLRWIVEVTGDRKLAAGLLDDAVRYYRGWEKGFTYHTYPEGKPFPMGGDGKGMFASVDDREGTEMSLGGNGYRPFMNAAMYGEASVIAWAARIAGRTDLAEEFDGKAKALERGIKERLWNPERSFFTVRALDGKLGDVRELHGYAPWYFGLGLAGYEKAWERLTDETGFYAPFGLTCQERCNPNFKIAHDGHACQWNGPVWPFATSLALTAYATYLQTSQTSQTFFNLLRQYAASQVLKREDGKVVPWIDENIDPFTGEWLARAMREKLHKGTKRYLKDRGKDYNHSTFCDLVIGGLCGFVPRDDGKVELKPLAPKEWNWWCLDGVRYHGRDVTVLFDRDGTRYGKGKGLVVLDERDRKPGWVPGPRQIVYPADDKALVLPVSASDYDVRLLDGAEGSVTFVKGAVRIVKTNGRGAVSVVTKKPVALQKAKALRVSAEVEGLEVGPGARSFLRIGPKPADGSLIEWEQKTLGFVFAGREKMETLYPTPRGRPQQKIAQVAVTKADCYVEIRLAGGPSESVWRDLRVDDVDEVIATDLAVRMQPHDFSADVTDEGAFLARIASDREHTAKVVRAGDYAQLRVDGEIVPPVLYLSYGSEEAAKIVHGGRRMQEIGMPLQVVNASFTSPRKGEKPIWTAEGFDARRAVAYVSRQMRTAPDALFLICIGCNLPEDIRLKHPEDYWLDAKGEPCLGDDGHLFGGEAVPLAKKVYPWLSYSSPAWRQETKGMIAALIAELKRTGLAKRIVGVHFGGGHDGQFCTAQPDFSTCAKAAFGKSGEKDYVRFLKRVPQEMMDDFAREVRKGFGKDVLVVRWCQRMFDGRYCSSHDVDAFEDSKEVDAIVTQPNYFHRSPGLVSNLGVPFSSFHAAGKLYIREHDLRTYGAWGFRGSHHNVVKDAGLSRSTDLSDWCAVNRKLAGQMLARRTGFWYYDMQSGWYDPPEIAAEIKDVLDIARKLYSKTPDPWRPTAALVIDEEDLRGLQSVDGPCGAAAYPLFTFLNNVASSGVPFDIWMKRDFTSARAAKYRYVVTYDRATKGLSPTELNAAAAKAGAFVAAKGGDTLVEMSGDFLSLHALTRGVRKIRLPHAGRVLNLKTFEAVPVADGSIEADLDVGETRWYALGAFADEFNLNSSVGHWEGRASARPRRQEKPSGNDADARKRVPPDVRLCHHSKGESSEYDSMQ